MADFYCAYVVPRLMHNLYSYMYDVFTQLNYHMVLYICRIYIYRYGYSFPLCMCV